MGEVRFLGTSEDPGHTSTLCMQINLINNYSYMHLANTVVYMLHHRFLYPLNEVLTIQVTNHYLYSLNIH